MGAVPVLSEFTPGLKSPLEKQTESALGKTTPVSMESIDLDQGKAIPEAQSLHLPVRSPTIACSMAVRTSTLRIETRGNTDVRDLTSELQALVEESRLRQGSLLLFVSGSTAGVTTVEYEPGLVRDLEEAFERLAPRDRPYHHHERWGDDNGHSHVRASVLGPSLSVPFSEGRLLLGPWQQIVLIDFDTRGRTREVVVQLQGE